MRIRIDRTEEAGGVTIRVAGWLDDPGLEELKRACEDARPCLRLDLSELRAADPGGLEGLVALQRAGAVFVGVPPYIDALLRARRRRPGPESTGRS